MNIIFNGLNINDGVNYFVEENNHEDVAPQEVNSEKIARTNDTVILRKNFGVKTIKVTLIVKDVSQSALDSRLDTLRKTIEAVGKNLDVDYAGITRRYVCTGFIKSVDRKKMTWARIGINFICYSAFGEDTTSTTLNYNDKTTATHTEEITIGGTAPAQPTIQITINSVTGTGAKFIQIKNVDTGDYVKITADDFLADDVIIISTRTALVTRNGVVTEYLGIMPEWVAGVNTLEYSDDFDARQVDIQFSYKKRYL